MKTPSKLHLTLYLLALGGAALFTVLLIRQGIGQVLDAFVTAEWTILGIAAYHFIPIFLDAAGWWVLFPRSGRPPLFKLFWMRWIGESISTLVPSAAVGGDVVRARLATITGVPLSISAASVIVDLTLGIFMQAGFTLLGLALLVNVTGQRNLIGPTLLGIVVALLAFGGFYLAQRLGMFRFLGRIISRLASSPEWSSLGESGETLDRTIHSLYARRRGVLVCCLLTILSLLVGSGEVWLAMWVIDLPDRSVTLANALIFQSMALTVRAAAFPVPGGLGVQEGGYLAIGHLLGIPGESAFALSLIARARELGIGIPGLITWQFVEGRRLWRRRAAAGR
jgi:putative membrane protein